MTTPTGIEIIGYVIVSNIDSRTDWDDELHPSIEAAIDSLTGTYSPLCRSEEDRTKAKKPWWEEYEIHPVLKAIERRKHMTDHGQAAIEAAFKKLEPRFLGQPRMRCKEATALAIRAAEPHLRKKWAEEVRKRLPDLLCAEEDDQDGIATSHEVLYLDDAASSIDLHQNIAAIAAKIVEGAGE